MSQRSSFWSDHGLPWNVVHASMRMNSEIRQPPLPGCRWCLKIDSIPGPLLLPVWLAWHLIQTGMAVFAD